MILLRNAIFLFLIVISGCTGTRRMLHDAQVLEEAGMKSRAFEHYQSVYRTKGDTRALVGMRRVAQSLLDEHFRNAQMLCLREQYIDALDAYDKAFAFADQQRELELRTPVGVREQKQQCVTGYVDHLYRQAESAVLDERYEEARQHLTELRRIDPFNRKADYLHALAEIIPSYNLGKKAYELGLYREAYHHFLEVTRRDAAYKDALTLREECLSKSKIPLAYLLIDNTRVDPSIETSTGAMIKNAILNLNDPFIQLIDRENIEQMLAEQIKGMSGLIDEKTAIQAGRLTGARYLLTGEIVNYDHLTAPQRGFERKAYLGPSVSSKKVRYTEYRLGRGLDVSFRYQIIDAETGRMFATGIIPFSDRDNVIWADFTGDHSLLYPGDWKWQLISSKEDVVHRDQRDDLMAQFNGRKGPVSEQELRSRMMNIVAGSIAEVVRNFRP